MQTINDSNCDDQITLITTDEINKRATFNVIHDNGVLYIQLESKGVFYLKLGFQYTLVSNSPNDEYTLDKYVIIEHKFEGDDCSISVGIGWNWYSEDLIGELSDDFFEEHDGLSGFIKKFDVIELKHIKTQ